MKKVYAISAILAGSLLTLGTALSFVPLSANEVVDAPEVERVFVETGENNSVHGDSILVVYSTPMLILAQPYPLAGGMQDVNNVPGSELEAPAEYPAHHGNANGQKAAHNYQIRITPGPYSRTQFFEGTWADLGGEAIYHPSDQTKKIVLLVPPQPSSKLFEPGDQIEITVATTVKSPHGQAIKAGKNKAREIAS